MAEKNIHKKEIVTFEFYLKKHIFYKQFIFPKIPVHALRFKLLFSVLLAIKSFCGPWFYLPHELRFAGFFSQECNFVWDFENTG